MRNKNLIDMTDSTDDFVNGRFDVLLQRLHADGFLFIRGLIPKPTVLVARKSFISQLEKMKAINRNVPMSDADIADVATTRKKKMKKEKGKQR